MTRMRGDNAMNGRYATIARRVRTGASPRPKLVKFGERELFQNDAARRCELLDGAETGGEFPRAGVERGLGIKVEFAGELDHSEKEIAEFVFDFRSWHSGSGNGGASQTAASSARGAPLSSSEMMAARSD